MIAACNLVGAALTGEVTEAQVTAAELNEFRAARPKLESYTLAINPVIELLTHPASAGSSIANLEATLSHQWKDPRGVARAVIELVVLDELGAGANRATRTARQARIKAALAQIRNEPTALPGCASPHTTIQSCRAHRRAPG